jgi:hypothetical protein
MGCLICLPKSVNTWLLVMQKGLALEGECGHCGRGSYLNEIL